LNETEERNSIKIFGQETLCADLVSLIRMKQAAGRAKDIEAIAELQAIWEEQQDLKNNSDQVDTDVNNNE